MNLHQKYLDYAAITALLIMLIISAGAYIGNYLTTDSSYLIAIPSYLYLALLIRYKQRTAFFWLLLIAAYIHGWFFVACLLLLVFDIVFRRVF